MKRDDQHQLLNEVLGGERLEALRQVTLGSGLGVLRRRRHRRRIAKACALACLPLIAALVFLLPRETSPTKSNSLSPMPSLQNVPAGDPNTTVKIIGDDELFALFPNRAMALVGKPGHQQVVFLDQPAGGESVAQ